MHTQQKRPLFAPMLLTILAGQLLTLFIVAIQGFAIRGISTQPTPTLIQETTGDVMVAHPVPANERTPAVIQQFVSQVLAQLLSMNGTITTVDGKQVRDPGIAISTIEAEATATEIIEGNRKPLKSSNTGRSNVGSAKVTTNSVIASFALAADFRQSFLERLSTLTPQGVFTGRQKAVLTVDQISEPQLLESSGDANTPKTNTSNKWQLNVVANLTVFDGNNAPIKTIPFNREVVVETTSIPSLPQGDNPLEQAIYAIRLAGLQITDIRPIGR